MQSEKTQHASEGKSRSAKLWGIAVYSGIVAIPAVVASIHEPPIVGSLIDFGVTLSGVLAYTIFALQFALAARIPFVERTFGYTPVMTLHKAMAIVGTLLVVAHMALLIMSRGNWNLVINPWESWPVQIGRLAVLALLAILPLSFGRKYIPIHQKDWLWFHNALAWLILILGFVHSIVLGSAFDHSIFALIWIGYFLFAVATWIWKKYGTK